MMKEKIRKLLQDAKTKEALELLVTIIPEAGVLLTTFNEAKKRNSLGLLKFELFSEKQTEVTYAALNMLADWSENESSHSGYQDNTSVKKEHMKKVFISYSHKDEDAMKELDKFLGPLERDGKISIWTDRKILPGQTWKNEILRELESTDLTLLLVSANFLDSEFIHTEEIPRAFKRRSDHGKPIVPIILNYCLWDITILKDLQAVPQDGRPVADFANAAQAWNEVAKAILSLLNS